MGTAMFDGFYVKAPIAKRMGLMVVIHFDGVYAL